MAQALPKQGGSAREAVMFALSLLWLLVLGLVLPHLGVSLHINRQFLAMPLVHWTLFGLWALIVLESVLGLLQALAKSWSNPKPALGRCLLIALIPPCRLAFATHVPGRWIWLPGLGWHLRDADLFERMEHGFAIPMLLVTLLIVPVVIAELFLQSLIMDSAAFAHALHALTALIWFAFATEFILGVSVASNKLTYCKQHWVNMVIILLPLVAFLRTLMVFRMLRLGKVGQLLRAFRLRGLLVRAQRIAMLLNLIDRVLQRNPERYLETLRHRERNKLRELERIRNKIKEVEAKLAAGNPRHDSSIVTGKTDERK